RKPRPNPPQEEDGLCVRHTSARGQREGRSRGGVVDTQAAAVRDGLVAKLGQDRVQEIIAAAFTAVRDDLFKFEDIEAEPTFADDAWSAPGWCDAAVDYHKDRGDRVSVRPYTADELARLARADGRRRVDRARVARNQPSDRPRGGKHGRGADAGSARARYSGADGTGRGAPTRRVERKPTARSLRALAEAQAGDRETVARQRCGAPRRSVGDIPWRRMSHSRTRRCGRCASAARSSSIRAIRCRRPAPW